MRYAVLVSVCLAACNNGAKDREIAELKARVAAQEQEKARAAAAAPTTPPPTTVSTAPTSSRIDPRAPLLLQLCVTVEEHGGATLYNFGIKEDDVYDENGHVKDPSAFCSLVRDKSARVFGKGSSHNVLVNTYGPELGTQVWNGSLCADPPIHFDRVVPTREELLARLAAKVNTHVGGWAREVHQKPSDLLDENGHLRDPSALAAAIRTNTIKRQGKNAKHVMMQSANFGAELGAALYSGRLDPPAASTH